MITKWSNAGLSLAAALLTALVTLVSGLLMLLVGPMLAVVGGLLMVQGGKVRFVGLGMAVVRLPWSWGPSSTAGLQAVSGTHSHRVP